MPLQDTDPTPSFGGFGLRLVSWLQKAGEAVMGEVTNASSQYRDTLLTVSIRRPVTVEQMRAEFPEVARITSEPTAVNMSAFSDSVSSPVGTLKVGAGQSLPLRFRIVFRAGV